MGRPAGVIANTDNHNRSGSHWVAIFINKKGRGIFFDSYGFPPKISHFKDRLRKNATAYVWNTKQLQSFNSKVCGQFCIMFLYYMNKGYSLGNFCRLFSSNYLKNDSIVSKFYNNVKKICKIKKNVKKQSMNKFIGKGNCESNKKNIWIQACIPKMMM